MHLGRYFGLVLAVGSSLLTARLTQAATPAELWPTQVPAPAEAGTLEVRLGALANAGAALPAAVGPAVKFEEAFLRILAAAPPDEWLPQVRVSASTTVTDPVSVGVREVARTWLARVEMEKIGTILDQYFAEAVRYPATFAEVEKLLPAELRTDPWGEVWAYQTHAPKGFAGETLQRYQLGPKRDPGLDGLRQAVGERKPFAPPNWKVTLRVTTNNRALEFQQNGATKGVIAAGGKIDEDALLYVGDHWALMAGVDQLFTVSF